MTTAFDDLTLLRLQAEVLFRHDARGRLLASNEWGDPPAPRLFLGRSRMGNLWRLRHDLPDDLAAALDALLAHEPVVADLTTPPATLPALEELLATHAPLGERFEGPAWEIPAGVAPSARVRLLGVADAPLLATHFPISAAELATRLPCAALLVDDEAVSVCFSARWGDTAAEAGVATALAHRGQGYAGAVVAGWARAVRACGRVPLYSTAWDNLASRRVAARLGMWLYGVDLSIG